MTRSNVEISLKTGENVNAGMAGRRWGGGGEVGEEKKKRGGGV